MDISKVSVANIMILHWKDYYLLEVWGPEREWTSLLSKASSLSINCKILKLFPQWSRHRSHHTQKVIPNVVARHQLLNTSPDNGIFPITKICPGSWARECHFSANI